MKKTFVFLVCFTISLSVFGQSKQLRKYYYWINQAELAICDSNYAYANECYDEAFSIRFPFPKDLFSAYFFNLNATRDLERIQEYARLLVECGDYGLSERYSRDGEVDTTIYEQLQQIETNCHSLCDTSLQRCFEEMLEKDQSYPHKWGKGGEIEDSLNHIVMHYIENIFEKYENITPKTAGLYYIAYLHTPAAHYVHSLEHSFQEFIKKEVINGTLSADLYMDLEDEYLCWNKVIAGEGEQSDPNGYGQGSYYFYRLGGTFFITYPTNLKLVNKHRKALGVSETFEDLVKKITWEYSHNIVKWHSIVNMGYGNEEADKETAIQLKKEIDAEHAAGDFHRMYFEKELKVSE